jgi:transposase-like protein
VKNSRMARRYGEDFKRQAVELVVHGGKAQRQVAEELDVSEYSLNLWRKKYLQDVAPAQIDGQQKSAKQLVEENRQLRKENEYLKGQGGILKKAMSILGEESTPGMR